MIDRSSLKKLSRFLMRIFVYVIWDFLVSVVIGIILGNIMLVIIVLLALIPNLDLMSGIAISNVQLVTITSLATWLIIASISLVESVWIRLTGSKGITRPSDTQ